MAERPWGTELIVAGDFSVELEKIGGRGRDEEIMSAVETAGLEDLSGNFLPRRRVWCKDKRTWEVVSQGKAVRSWTD